MIIENSGDPTKAFSRPTWNQPRTGNTLVFTVGGRKTKLMEGQQIHIKRYSPKKENRLTGVNTNYTTRRP